FLRYFLPTSTRSALAPGSGNALQKTRRGVAKTRARSSRRPLVELLAFRSARGERIESEPPGALAVTTSIDAFLQPVTTAKDWVPGRRAHSQRRSGAGTIPLALVPVPRERHA